MSNARLGDQKIQQSYDHTKSWTPIRRSVFNDLSGINYPQKPDRKSLLARPTMGII